MHRCLLLAASAQPRAALYRVAQKKQSHQDQWETLKKVAAGCPDLAFEARPGALVPPAPFLRPSTSTATPADVAPAYIQYPLNTPPAPVCLCLHCFVFTALPPFHTAPAHPCTRPRPPPPPSPHHTTTPAANPCCSAVAPRAAMHTTTAPFATMPPHVPPTLHSHPHAAAAPARRCPPEL